MLFSRNCQTVLLSISSGEASDPFVEEVQNNASQLEIKVVYKKGDDTSMAEILLAIFNVALPSYKSCYRRHGVKTDEQP